MNTDHRQYLRYCRRRRLRLWMGGGVEKAVAVEVVQPMKNCRSASAHRIYIELSSSTPWTVSTKTTAAYLSRGVHTAPCISGQPPQAASALIHSMHEHDHPGSIPAGPALAKESGEYDLL